MKNLVTMFGALRHKCEPKTVHTAQYGNTEIYSHSLLAKIRESSIFTREITKYVTVLTKYFFGESKFL